MKQDDFEQADLVALALRLSEGDMESTAATLATLFISIHSALALKATGAKQGDPRGQNFDVVHGGYRVQVRKE